MLDRLGGVSWLQIKVCKNLSLRHKIGVVNIVRDQHFVVNISSRVVFGWLFSIPN